MKYDIRVCFVFGMLSWRNVYVPITITGPLDDQTAEQQLPKETPKRVPTEYPRQPSPRQPFPTQAPKPTPQQSQIPQQQSQQSQRENLAQNEKSSQNSRYVKSSQTQTSQPSQQSQSVKMKLPEQLVDNLLQELSAAYYADKKNVVEKFIKNLGGRYFLGAAQIEKIGNEILFTIDQKEVYKMLVTLVHPNEKNIMAEMVDKNLNSIFADEVMKILNK